MERQIIKAGWIEKKSQYLKKWRKRLLVLTSSSLATYKSEGDNRKSTMEIPLNTIVDASPLGTEQNNDFIFIVSLSDDKYYLRVSNDGEMCAWLNLINHTRNGNRISSFSSPNYYHESKALSDESLITSFTRMKELMHRREEELLSSLDELYNIYVNKATQEYKEISDRYEQECQNYDKIQAVLKNSSSIVTKTRELQNASKTHMNFKELEAYNISKLIVSIPEDNIDKLIKSCIKVCLGNPAEVMIRRTHITRALKWRYTGEKIDAITFSVNKDVKLTGIGLCTPYKPGRITYVKEFEVLKGSSTNSNSMYRHSQIVPIPYNPESSIFKVIMEKQVLIKKDNKYTVYFLNNGSHTYKCVDCISVIEGPEKVLWTFSNSVFSLSHQSNRCDTVCGPIADFYFIVV
ncbi:hypothetical protein SteCoe_27068 [Stentor coeruleus]|uniref:PH domain-containing protein n=1 Tax=Stentor coeruleus TaxID=5963 RepID=A0A1R2BBN3_9CILI|nr:hypothetical protein SteCoe_27068 [Stentor coeruleus]